MKPTVDKENFPEMVSRPHSIWTWVVRVIFALFVLIPVAAVLYWAPVLLYREARPDDNGGLLLLGIYYVLITVLLIWHFKRAKHKAIAQIKVDRSGIHYEKLNGTTDSILYAQLEKAPSSYKHDVFTENSYFYMDGRLVGIDTYLKVFREGSKTRVPFANTDVAFASVTINRKSLQGHFIRGLLVFRPDLVISPSVIKNKF